MQILVSGRHLDVEPSLKQYATDKVQKLTRYYDRIQSIEVVYDHQGGKPSVEVIVNTEPKNTFIGHETGEDMFAVIDIVVDKLERQLTRHKEKHRNRKHPQ